MAMKKWNDDREKSDYIDDEKSTQLHTTRREGVYLSYVLTRHKHDHEVNDLTITLRIEDTEIAISLYPDELFLLKSFLGAIPDISPVDPVLYQLRCDDPPQQALN